MNRHLCCVFFVQMLCAVSLPAQRADPIGHKRLAQAHAFAANAEALANGGAEFPHKRRLDAANKLENTVLRHELKIMVEAVRVKFTSIQLEPVQNNVLAHIRMIRHQLTNDKVDRSLEDMRKTIRKHRNNEKKYSPTRDLQDQVEAINAVLRSQ